MRISLKQLNDCFPALVRLCQQALPKEQIKLTYQLAKLFTAAKSEMESLTRALNDLQEKCGLFEERSENNLRNYNELANNFLRDTQVDLPGHEIVFDSLVSHVSLSPHDLGLLDWLILLDQETEDQESKFYEWPPSQKIN